MALIKHQVPEAGREGRVSPIPLKDRRPISLNQHQTKQYPASLALSVPPSLPSFLSLPPPPSARPAPPPPPSGSLSLSLALSPYLCLDHLDTLLDLPSPICTVGASEQDEPKRQWTSSQCSSRSAVNPVRASSSRARQVRQESGQEGVISAC